MRVTFGAEPGDATTSGGCPGQLAALGAGHLAALDPGHHPADLDPRGDPVAVVDTDKAAIEVESFHDGVVGRLLVEPGARAVGSGDGPVSAGDVRNAAAARRSAGERRTHLEPSPTGEPLTAAEKARIQPGATILTMPSRVSRRGAVAHLMSRSKREIPHYYVAATGDLDALISWLRRTNRDRPISERIVPAEGILRAPRWPPRRCRSSTGSGSTVRCCRPTTSTSGRGVGA